MKDDEIKRANRKALPKFLLFALLCAIVGGVIGYFSGYGSAKGSADKLSDIMEKAGEFFGTNIAPWIIVAAAVGVPAACVPIYLSAKKLLENWDGEDDDVSGAVDRKLSVVTWITSAAFISSYFLIAAAYSGQAGVFDDKLKTTVFFAGVIAFLAIVIEAIVFQQKCVDTIKRMNPEKKVSVYDARFKKKWIEECDEAEKILIGKCAFKAYSATNVACAISSLILVLSAPVFGTGFLPSLAVCLVWIINTTAYFKEALKYGKAGNKLS